MIRGATLGLVPLAFLVACDSAMVDRVIIPYAPPPSTIEVKSIEVIPLERPHERRQLALRRGDPLSVDAQTFAIVRYTNGSVVYVRPGSRVRLGSFSLDFGAIFAKVQGALLRGAFQVDTEFVIAGAHGTEYEVKVDARNGVSVTVLEGQVLCTSKTGLWHSFLMSAGQKVNILGVAARDAASDDDIREIRRWVARLEAADRLPPAPRGFCCADGKVFRSSAEDCTGYFSLDEKDARGRCAPPAETGYCCQGNKVSRTTRQECRGYWATSVTSADEECLKHYSSPADPSAKPEIDKTPPTRVEKDETIADLNALADILNQVVNHVNSIGQSLNGKNHQAAERSLENARNAFARSNAAFERLGTKKNRAAFHDAYKVAKELREIQSSLLAVSSVSIDLHRSDDMDGYSRSVAEHNQLISSYNQKINQLNAVTSDLRK